MLPLTTKQHDELLRIYRKDPDPELRFRAHLILLLAGGHAWDTIEAMLFCSSRTVDRWLKRFQAEGVAGLTGRKRGRPFRLGLGWVAVLVSWVTTQTPSDFGFLRSRWSCVLLAVLLREREGVTASRETVRRWLHRGRLVYRRPRPTLKPNEEERQAKLAELRKMLEGLPDNETAVWQDEVEVHTNPKIGRMWMLVGQQAEVETPGTNKKRHLSGSIHWRTGQVFVTEAAPKQGRNGCSVHQAPGRAAAEAAALPEDPRHLRQRGLSHQPGGDPVPLEVGGSDRGPLVALLLPGPEPDRARVVALAREHHAEPSVQRPGGITGPRVRLARAGKPIPDRGFGLPEGQCRLSHFPFCKFLFSPQVGGPGG